jgi:hypothetical protein
MMLSAGVEHLVIGVYRTVGIVSLADVCRSLLGARTVTVLPGEPPRNHRPRRAAQASSLSRPPGPIGPMVRHLRHRADLTLERLSQLSGISDRALSDIEREVATGPQHRTVLAIARALDLAEPDRAGLFEAARAGRLRTRTSGSRSARASARPVLAR